MATKKTPHFQLDESIGGISNEYCSSSILYLCKEYLKDYRLQADAEGQNEEIICDCTSCRMWEHNAIAHCVLLQIDESGPMTLEQIATVLGLTPEIIEKTLAHSKHNFKETKKLL